MNNRQSTPVTDLCPYCHQSMAVKAMQCSRCQVVVEANFPSTRLGQLAIEHQRFIEMFVLASGSLKEIASQTQVSYPTVRARLDRIIDELRQRIEASAAVVDTRVDTRVPTRVPTKALDDKPTKLVKVKQRP